MSEEEKDILVSKRNFWVKLMKYNWRATIFFTIFIFTIFIFLDLPSWYFDLFLNPITNLTLFFLLISWALSFIMYIYQDLKIYKIPKPKVLAKSSGNFEALVKKDRMKNPTLALISDHLWWLAFVAKLGLISMLISFSLLIMAGL